MKKMLLALNALLLIISCSATGGFESQFSIPLKKPINEYSAEEQKRFEAIHQEVRDILTKAYTDINAVLDTNAPLLNAMRTEDDEHITISMEISK